MNLKLIHARKETYHTKMCTGEKTQLAVTEEAWVPVLPHSATNSSDLESVLHSPGLSILIYEERALQ